ncbi:acyl-CoA dehydrogenase family protein [Actinokineospora cianjurensis]|uniref:Alkylation response protein AidB-like acyl-CoA dehydrogenase n=1 Tax=Actinokineospora cianjurensis TaxID=585224 RepID=A0A421BC53_9PSEU|nr:acyl-CoA dehydrogenase family protein [Actinokineospora cianjurensis]RLK61952.1 alkylation response protein AidB-like acyl-CoA dehydrogenase [Actinokineospora cianjurensis]
MPSTATVTSSPESKNAELPSAEFIEGIRAIAREHFDSAFLPQEELPRQKWELLTRAGVLLPALPTEFGGRDSHLEMCRVIEAIAEWNLPLAMYAKIISAVALRPIVMRASEPTRTEVLSEFGTGAPLICGFASTEPGCGSNMSAMRTTFEPGPAGYRLRGHKHWQGFSTTADWWLVSAKNDDNGREYGYFVLRREEGFTTTERYTPMGMRLLDYGLNEIDATVPAHRRLDAANHDLSAMPELLTPPRSMMASIAAGFLRRISRETRAYAERRPLGRGTLADIGFVRYRIRAVESSATICRALAHHVETRMDLKSDMTESFPVSLALKTVATERMVSAANHYVQIAGGEGYRTESPTNIAAQAFLDTRVFTIFDGTNDLLSQQLTHHCQKLAAGDPLSSFLATWELTAPAVGAGIDLTFLDGPLAQEHLVLAGRAIAYAIAHTLVRQWSQRTTDVTDQARIAMAFLTADVNAIAVEFNLLAQRIL